MSRKITKDIFLERFNQRFPEAQIEILEYISLKNACKIKCRLCGKEFNKTRAESFLKSWSCCNGKNESKFNLVDRLCKADGHYEIVKILDPTHLIIKHLDCGNEITKTIQSAVSAPCSCKFCNTQSEKLRISLNDAQEQLNEIFEGNITVLFFDGVDSKKSQYRCNKCGLIFNQSYYNLISKCRGCPKCDARRSKGETAMRKYLDENGIKYKEQVNFKELGRLKFDFGILDKEDKIISLIEVQGDQHFKEVFRYPSRPDYFLIQQFHDEQKREWCKSKNIPLYEIINDCGKLLNLDILSNLNSTTISVKESTI